MSYAQQKQRHFAQLSTTLQRLARELEQTRDLMEQTVVQLNAMGKFSALHAAQMIAVEKIEEYVDEHGHLPSTVPANRSTKSAGSI
ncbi:uncharacterized protein EI90DRAFT_3068146 [Cantharellus anzutake]|uniref:uncharacterized protein n=1 Tax=Cantharellus anzutake TaxID=1750568 RepID=UPI001902FEB1|nr:uncharacterized protein EI90DRAFT_3068146 [Cantharellus anzutake]KAF8327165.1 hypothetical protein EI90DRAFT_3068146 [Cantharellus anzutake]